MFGRVGGRSRLAAVGAVVAVLFGGGVVLTASAAGSSQASSFVPITPCRLLDTRPSDVVGPRSTPLGAGTTYTAAVWGSNGNCTIPAGATGLSMNVVAISPTAASFLTVFPADQALPLASSLNWVAGQAPTPNAVTVSASADGRVSFYNQFGSVDLAVDIVGYYELSTSGPAGPQGEPGAPGTPGIKGDTGDPGPRPAQVVWVAQSGGDFTSLSAALASITDYSVDKPYLIRIAPGIYTESSAVSLLSYVDIEGSGQDVTTLTCACGTDFLDHGAATMATSGQDVHSEVRRLSVANTGGGEISIAIATDEVTSNVSFDHVSAIASGGTSNFAIATFGAPNAPTLTSVTATASGGDSAVGVLFDNSSTSTLTNVTITATASAAPALEPVGVWMNAGGTIQIQDSSISATGASVFKLGGGTIHIADSILNGPTINVGAANCVDVMTPALAPYTCA